MAGLNNAEVCPISQQKMKLLTEKQYLLRKVSPETGTIWNARAFS